MWCHSNAGVKTVFSLFAVKSKFLFKMKSYMYIIVGLVLTIFILTNNAMEVPDHLKGHAKKLHKRCQNQTNTLEEVIKSSLSGTLPKDANFECYVHCLFDIIGLIDESNVMRLENMLQILPEEMHPMIKKLTEACGTKEGDDKCKIAYNTMQCYVDNNPLILSDNLKFLFD